MNSNECKFCGNGNSCQNIEIGSEIISCKFEKYNNIGLPQNLKTDFRNIE